MATDVTVGTIQPAKDDLGGAHPRKLPFEPPQSALRIKGIVEKDVLIFVDLHSAYRSGPRPQERNSATQRHSVHQMLDEAYPERRMPMNDWLSGRTPCLLQDLVQGMPQTRADLSCRLLSSSSRIAFTSCLYSAFLVDVLFIAEGIIATCLRGIIINCNQGILFPQFKAFDVYSYESFGSKGHLYMTCLDKLDG
ncbi:uncharacterized protein BDR25DRAFT_348567 [Lindgomyces ingoldianus]|uniref:Uncharacterized protein n=1 Tax=Lindgomyces ingoldianus TaxID=673940 RepID=A0ACB6RG60_9PLEO|nr:uncharacterized protein BDR25DRAFT_348567 [Lindgomyces ingoldianus]KAF2478308.1 hypothetical protein BDR25DRAFT_348567 [Lindgomyces ingoldianus]